MALSYAQYLGNGTNRNFNVTFPFISKDHVKVRVGGTLVSFSWLTATTIQLATAPGIDAVVDVRRVTPRDRLLVDFKDASVLVETDLDLSALQVFYLSQEAFDLGEASLGVTEDGSYSALNRRISNVLDPVGNQDVVTKLWAETALSSQLAIAAGHAASALASKNAAATSEANTLTYKNASSSSASASATSAADALASKNAAATSEANALASKNAAAASATSASGYASDALASKNAAAASALAAATYDPANFYTKTQIDGFRTDDLSTVYTKTQIDGFRTSDQNTAKNAGNLTSGTVANDRLPLRLKELAGSNGIDDANAAVVTGWYMARNTASNLPSANYGFLEVQAVSVNEIRQYLTLTTGTVGEKWTRRYGSGSWSSWVRVYETAADIQAIVSAGRKLISVTEISSAVSAIDLTAFDSTKYMGYEIFLSEVVLNTAQAAICGYTSSNSGTTWDNGTNNYAWGGKLQVYGASNSSGTYGTVMQFMPGSTDGARVDSPYEGISGIIKLMAPEKLKNTKFASDLSYCRYYDAAASNWEGYATRLAQAAVNGLRLFPSSGNFTSGTIYFFGIPKV